MNRRTRHTPMIGKGIYDRRKAVFDRRRSSRFVRFLIGMSLLPCMKLLNFVSGGRIPVRPSEV